MTPVVTRSEPEADDLSFPAIPPQDLTFVICVEGNVLGSQAILLCESLRRYGGAYADCPVWAISPRPELPVDAATAAALAAVGVEVISRDLNHLGSTYGTINRIVAGAWAEANIATSYICVLDTDMIFVRPPRFVEGDAGVRPVDLKGMASAGPGDPMERYWAGICAIAGIPVDALPMLETTCCKSRIRASYNGGMLVAKRSVGILAETERVFLESFRQDLRPTPDVTRPIYSSIGHTEVEAATWWGSSQAVLAAVISARAQSIHLYGNGYNIPLHLFARTKELLYDPHDAVLIHYHYLAAEEHRASFLAAIDRIGCPVEVRDWIALRAAQLPWPITPRG